MPPLYVKSMESPQELFARNRKRPLAEQYYNPQEDPGSEKRTIIVIAFTLLLLIGAQFYFKSPQAPADNKPATTAPVQNPVVGAAPATKPVPSPGGSKGTSAHQVEAATKQAASESETV